MLISTTNVINSPFRDKLSKLIESLNTQLTDKGAEINGYMEKHNIQIRGQGNDSKKVILRKTKVKIVWAEK